MSNQPRDMHHIDLTVAHRRMLAADHAYGNCPCPEHNMKVCRAQRSHAAAIRYDMHRKLANDGTNADEIGRIASRYWEKRAKNIWKRALQNTKRELDDPAWQALAAHQLARARGVMRRAMAIADMLLPVPPPKIEREEPTHKRVIHPITGRYVLVEVPKKSKRTTDQEQHS